MYDNSAPQTPSGTTSITSGFRAGLRAWPAHIHITVATAQSIEMQAGQNPPEDISTATLDYIAARQTKSKEDSLQMYYRHIHGHYIKR